MTPLVSLAPRCSAAIILWLVIVLTLWVNGHLGTTAS